MAMQVTTMDRPCLTEIQHYKIENQHLQKQYIGMSTKLQQLKTEMEQDAHVRSPRKAGFPALNCLQQRMHEVRL